MFPFIFRKHSEQEVSYAASGKKKGRKQAQNAFS